MGTLYHYELVIGLPSADPAVARLRQRCAAEVEPRKDEKPHQVDRRLSDWLAILSKGRLAAIEVHGEVHEVGGASGGGGGGGGAGGGAAAGGPGEGQGRPLVVGVPVARYSQKSAPCYVGGPWTLESLEAEVESCRTALRDLGIEAEPRIFLLADVG